MEIKTKKGMEPFTADEHPRETTLEKLAKLPPVFKENGVVTAGNASVSITLFIICRNRVFTHFLAPTSRAYVMVQELLSWQQRRQ